MRLRPALLTVGTVKRVDRAPDTGHPMLKKDAAFTERERDQPGLRGLLP